MGVRCRAMNDPLLACVVVVDDSEDYRYLVRRAIQRAQLTEEIVECGDAESALEVLFERLTLGPTDAFTLALVDVNMPRMNGFELLDRLGVRLGRLQRKVPVIVAVSSSSEQAADVQRALAHPLVDAYVAKPPVWRSLRELVESQLKRRASASAR